MRQFLLLPLLAMSCESSAPPDRELIRKKVAAALPPIQRCYEKATATQPDLEGKLILKWELLPNGRVGQIAATKPLENSLDACVIKEISQLQFTPPPKGTMPTIEYPFSFKRQ